MTGTQASPASRIVTPAITTPETQRVIPFLGQSYRVRVSGQDTEEFGVLHDGDIVAVEFNFKEGLEDGRQELIDSVLATVEFR
jgi:hypothetical protein